MSGSSLHAIDNAVSNTFAKAFETVFPTGPAVVKTLNSKFESFGDALFSWTNSEGFTEQQQKTASDGMVFAFCRALGIPFVSGDSKSILSNEHYFESDQWFFDFVEEKNYMRLGFGIFMLLDEHYRPIAWMDIDTNHSSNISVKFSGAEHLMLEFREVMLKNVKTDEAVEKKTSYVEVVVSSGRGMGMGMGEALTISKGKIDNPRTALPEYYPYIPGGIENMLKDFVESEESVLILMGPPGTGKSSLVAAGVKALGLLPIYAKRADAIADKGFVNFVFKISDDYMTAVAGTSAKARSDLFIETLYKEKEAKINQALDQNQDGDKEEPRLPIIVVEDADVLLAPRSTGNLMMAELLNETDGIGSNHARKIIFTTNLANTKAIDEALMRAGRCYDVVNCRLLTPEEAIAARAANGLPDFDVTPTGDVSLAEALRKPRKRISVSNGKASIGFNS